MAEFHRSSLPVLGGKALRNARVSQGVSLCDNSVTLLTSPMDQTCNQLWQKLSVALKPQVSPDTFKRWFSAVELVNATDDSLTFSVPNNIYQFWIESNHMAALQSAISSALGGPREVKFCPPSGSGNEVSATSIAVAEDQPETPRDLK